MLSFKLSNKKKVARSVNLATLIKVKTNYKS